MKSKKVLIVENNDLNRKLFESLIGQIYSFKAVKSGVEAVGLACREKFDLILMDIQLPDMEGNVALKTIRRQSTHQCPILAVTAYPPESSRKCFLEMGFDDLITKPIHPKEFLEVISSKIAPIKEEGPQNSVIQKDILDKQVLHQLLKYNSITTIKSIYGDFLQEFDELMRHIDTAFKEKNQQVVIENLHIIKGNSGTLGATAIFILSCHADKETRSQNWDSLEITLKKLKNERKTFEKYLEEETTFNL